MSKLMKKEKILPILLAIWPYMIAVLSHFEGETMVNVTMYLYLPVTAALYIWNMINAFKYKGENAARELAFFNMIIKHAHIPFYLCVFAIGAMFTLASVVPALTFVTPMILINLFITDTILLFISSMYGVNAIRHAYKRRMITGKSAIKNLIMHFIFVLDVISAINLYCKVKKQKGESPNE